MGGGKKCGVSRVKVGIFLELKWRKIMKKYAEIAVKALL